MSHPKRHNSLQIASEKIKNGGVILCPTDTIYGLSCDARNESAIRRIQEIKGNDPGKPYIVLVNSDRLFNQCTSNAPEVAWDLIDQSDCPLTLVVPASNYLPEILRPNDMVAIRYVSGNYIADLIHKVNRPIVSTSANPSNEKSPSHFGEIEDSIIEKVDFVVEDDFDDSRREKASKMILLKENGEVRILRK